MPASPSPLLICARCCSLDIAGPEYPVDEDVMHCRQCGYTIPYKVMRRQVELALSDAIGQIHQRVMRKMSLGS